MQGKRIDITTPADADLYARLAVTTSQDLSAVPFKAYVFDPASTPETAVLEVSASWDATERQVVLEKPYADINGLLPAGETEKELAYRVLAGIGTGKRFFYGAFKIAGRGPAYAA